MNRRVPTAAFVVLLAGTVLDAGQNPAPAGLETPTFKVQVDYVEVDAVVTDANGAFARDLKAEDFHVLEDGKPQLVSSFSIVDIPIDRYEKPLFASQPIEPDTATNERPFDGRTYVMVIDDLHTNFARTLRTRAATRKFIEERLGANDLMAVVHTGGPADANQEFTNNKRLLLAAVDRTLGQKLESPTLSKTAEYYRTQSSRQPGDPLRDPEEFERNSLALRSLDALKGIADWLAGVRGRRKTILFFSEGIDYDLGDLNNASGSALLDSAREAIAAATRGNVSIFSIDPRGLAQANDETIGLRAYPDDSSLGLSQQSGQREFDVSQDSLRVLADETGGFAAVNVNDFSTAYDRIVRDNSTYYVLAYYPPTDKPGSLHSINVRVDRPGLTVRARRAYVTPTPAATAVANSGARPLNQVRTRELSAAIDSPIPVSGLTIQAFAAPFKGAAPNASVLIGVELRGRDLALTPDDRIVLSYAAVDAADKARGGNTESWTLNVKPDEKALMQQTGLRILERLDLRPGRYQLHLAAQNSGSGHIGSVVYDLEVPDFSKGALSMSGIVVTSVAGAHEPTLGPDPQLERVLPAPPIAIRTFPKQDELALFVEAYDNQASKAHTVDIAATVTTDEGRVMFKNSEVRQSAELGGQRTGGYGYTTRIPLKEFAPGRYVLTVSARSTLGDGSPVQRQLQFTVGER